MASVYALGLIGGSIATIAASYYGNKLTDEKGLTITSSQTTQEEPVPEQPIPEEPIPEEPVPEELVPEQPIPEEPVSQEPIANGATAPSLPDDNIENMAGGGFGRPSWAPLNADTATMSLQGSTASNFIAKVTGTYKRTITDIQRDLIDIDDQIRVLRTNEFINKRDENDQASKINEARKKYLVNVSEIAKNEKLIQFYDKKINDLIKPESVNTSGKFGEIVKQKFPQRKADKTATYPKENNPNDLNFDSWRDSAFNKFKSDFPDDPIGIKPKDGEDSNKWWSRISNLTSSASAQKSENIESELNTLITKKTDSITNLEVFKESDSKSKYDEVLEKLLSVRTKLKDIRNQIKELQNKRELLLSELSNYQLPKGLFEYTKQPKQKIYNLPKGDELTNLLNDLSGKSDEIKEIDNKISEHVSKSLNVDGTLSDDDQNKYNELTNERKNLERSKNDIISRIEGRSDEPLYKGTVDNTIDSREIAKKVRKLVYPRPLDQKQFLAQAKNKFRTQSKSRPDTKSTDDLKTARLKDLDNIKTSNPSLGTDVELHDFTDSAASLPTRRPILSPSEGLVPEPKLTTQQQNSREINAAFALNELLPSTNTSTNPSSLSAEILERSAPTNNALGGKSHSTRRHLLRSKPSRFKTHRTYGLH